MNRFLSLCCAPAPRRAAGGAQDGVHAMQLSLARRVCSLLSYFVAQLLGAVASTGQSLVQNRHNDHARSPLLPKRLKRSR